MNNFIAPTGIYRCVIATLMSVGETDSYASGGGTLMSDDETDYVGPYSSGGGTLMSVGESVYVGLYTSGGGTGVVSVYCYLSAVVWSTL